MNDDSYAAGKAIRTKVMGVEHVAKAGAAEFARPLQDFINEHAWGAIWTRPDLDLKSRSLITVAMLAALGRPHELTGHVRGALKNGVTLVEIREVLLHAAVYGGVPLASEGFRCVESLLKEDSEDQVLKSDAR